MPVPGGEPDGDSGGGGDAGGEDDSGGDGWGELLTPTGAPPPEVYGECALPLSPAPDPDVNQRSGLRFGKIGLFSQMRKPFWIIARTCIPSRAALVDYIISLFRLSRSVCWFFM